MATILLTCITTLLTLTWWSALAADLEKWSQCVRAAGRPVAVYAAFAFKAIYNISGATGQRETFCTYQAYFFSLTQTWCMSCGWATRCAVTKMAYHLNARRYGSKGASRVLSEGESGLLLCPSVFQCLSSYKRVGRLNGWTI